MPRTRKKGSTETGTMQSRTSPRDQELSRHNMAQNDVWVKHAGAVSVQVSDYLLVKSSPLHPCSRWQRIPRGRQSLRDFLACSGTCPEHGACEIYIDATLEPGEGPLRRHNVISWTLPGTWICTIRTALQIHGRHFKPAALWQFPGGK